MNRQPIYEYKDYVDDGGDIDVLYTRLSRDDELEGDSNSIKNQKAILGEYAARERLKNPVFFVDDGYSGTNFNRPGFEAAMEYVDAGRVKTFVVKDMSRFGRDYLKVGLYTEIKFPEANVRFVAINDGVDSQNSIDNDFTPFRNIINEWYAKDTSKKIRAVFKAKGMSGKPVTTHPPYGYLKSAEDKNVWILDEEAAEVIREIARLTLSGYGPTQTARILTERGIDTPYIHETKLGIKVPVKPTYPEIWDTQSVIAILSRMEYMGHTVNFKTYKKSYKNKKKYYNPRENWVIIKNTHPAIIDEETYEKIQRIRNGKRRVNRMGEPNKLSGMLYCADCGQKLYLCRGTTMKQSEYYVCSTYRKKKKNLCTSHQIGAKAVERLILKDLQAVVKYARYNEAEFLTLIRKKTERELAKAQSENEAERKRARTRISEIDCIIQRLYEDNVKGKISDERFAKMSETYEAEQKQLKERVVILKRQIDESKEENNAVDHFMKLVTKYMEVEELTGEMLREFVEKVVVYQAQRIDGVKHQSVKVIYNCIGAVEIPTAGLE